MKLQKRAAEVGFDWPAHAVLDKLEEEIAELKAAIARAKASQPRGKRVAEEIGDLLFVIANLARNLGVDAEAALRDANAKFVRRFRNIEGAGRGRPTPDHSTWRRWTISGTRPRRPREELRLLQPPR